MRAGSWVAALASGAIALAGCGGSETPTTGEPRAKTPAASTPTKGRPPGAPPVGDGEGGVRLQRIGVFDQPVYVTSDTVTGDLIVVEQCGLIKRLPAGGGEPVVFLDLAEQVSCGGEQGLLSVAFDPDVDEEPRGSGLLYVYFTDLEGDTRIVEFGRPPDEPGVADPESARELLRIDDFAPNHNGGQLQFGPDGLLYIGTGDGGGAGDPERTAQDLGSLLGKILRIDPRRRNARPEILARGLRNPWRFSFDEGNLWIGDVGQDEIEEIDAAPRNELEAGLNFGWSAYEGSQRFNEDQHAPDAREPVLEYPLDGGSCAVTGGYVVRDPKLRSLYGRYLYADFCAGELRSFTADPEREAADDVALGLRVPQLSSFGEDAAGRIYVTSLEGPVYRLVPDGG